MVLTMFDLEWKVSEVSVSIEDLSALGGGRGRAAFIKA